MSTLENVGGMRVMKMSEEEVCEQLLRAGAVDIRDVDGGEEPFLYSSGNSGPGYVMVKGLVARQEVFKPLVEQLAFRLIEEEVEFDYIAGNATGGMLPAYQCREYYQDLSGQEVGYVYIRSSQKEGGHKELVTGLEHVPDEKDNGEPPNWLVFEELVNFGETTMNSVKVLRSLGFIACEAATILHYAHGEVDERLADNGINLTYLTTLPRLLDVAVATGHYTADTVSSYREFLDNPSKWQSDRGIDPIQR